MNLRSKMVKPSLALVVAMAISAGSLGLGTGAYAAEPTGALTATTLAGQTGAANSTGATATATSSIPTESEVIESQKFISSERSKDPAAFDRKLRIVQSSAATMAYIQSFEGINVDLQVEALSAMMPEEALQGYTEMLDGGIIVFDVSKNSDGTFTSKMTVDSSESSSDGISALGLGSLPRCASAWAAFWAWFAVNGAMCGALAPMPVAAFACAAGFAVGGMIVDFNAGCK